MIRRMALASCMTALAGAAARGEITEFCGYVRAFVQEYRLESPGDSEDVSESFPDTSSELPLQVVARLLPAAQDAAACVGSQFADPTELQQPNPEEFAINLALLSESPEIRYSSTALSKERREVLFTTEDFPALASGATVSLVGQLYLDGALAVFSTTRERSLLGAQVTLNVLVKRQASGQSAEVVFSGSLTLEGGASGEVTQSASGDFPTDTVIRTDLASFVDDFALFEVLILPRMTIPYEYSAAIDEPFTLQASVEIDAANLPDGVGVLAILGTPVDEIRQVLATVQSEDGVSKTINALAVERSAPTGAPAFPTARTLWPACGLFGVESLAGVALLAGLRAGRFGRGARSA